MVRSQLKDDSASVRLDELPENGSWLKLFGCRGCLCVE
jgi:hypothetical protein